MKKWLCLLLVGILVLSLVACDSKKETETPTNDTGLVDEFKSIIDMYEEIVYIHKMYNPSDSYEKFSDNFSQEWYDEIFSATLIGDVSKNLYGYALTDLNADNRLEMVLLLEDYTIIAIFSIVDEKPFLISDFHHRRSCWLDKDKTIHISGSNGADDWTYSEYKLSSNGTELILLFEYGCEGYDNISNKKIYYMISDSNKIYIDEHKITDLHQAKPYLSLSEAAKNTERDASLTFISFEK